MMIRQMMEPLETATGGERGDLAERLRRKHRYEALHCLLLDEPRGLKAAFPADFLPLLRGRLCALLAEMRLAPTVVAFLVEEYRRRHDRDFVAGGWSVALDDPASDDVRLWDYLLSRLSRKGDPLDAGAYLELCRNRSAPVAA